MIGTALCTAFFASPAKGFLIKKLNERAGTSGHLKKTQSQEDLRSREPMLGLPSEPQKDLEELVSEVKAEVEIRQRKGIQSAEPRPVPDKGGL